MGFYNPHAPGIVGQEWVPIRYEPFPIPRGIEVGHGFRLTEPTALSEVLFYIDDDLPDRLNNQVVAAAVYPRGREVMSGPVHTNTPGVWGVIGGPNTNVPATPWIALSSPMTQNFVTLGPGTGWADISFAINGVGPPASARVLEVAWRYVAAGAFGEIPAGTIRVGIRNDDQSEFHWIADALNGPLTLATATRFERISAGATNVMWDNPNTAMAESLPWRAVDLNQFQPGGAVELWLRFDFTDLASPVQLGYIAMEVRWCAEERLAYGGTPYGADMNGVQRVYQLDNQLPPNNYNTIRLRDTDFVADPVLDPGDYTVTVTLASNGGLGSGGATPPIDALRQLYPMPDHPGMEIVLAGQGAVTERNRRYNADTAENPFWLVTATEHPTFEVHPTDVLPHLSIFDPDGNVVLGVHVYGRQTTRAPTQGNAVTQGIDVSVADGEPYPWLRFYARRLHHQAGIPLTVAWLVGSEQQVIGQLLPAEFEALPEIVDGWREVNMRLDPVPTLFPGGGRFFHDTFTRTVASGLGQADTGQQWFPFASTVTSVGVDGQQGVWDFTGMAATGSAVFRADGGGFRDIDLRVRTQVTAVGTYEQFLWVFARGDSGLGAAYDGRLRLLDDLTIDVEVGKQAGGFVSLHRVTTGLVLAADTWYWLRFRVEQDPNDPTQQLIQAKAWQDGTPQPAAWQASATDSDYPNPGFVGLATLADSPDGSARQMHVDDFAVVGEVQIGQLQFTAPGLSRPEQWQILGAESLGTDPRINSPATYGQPNAGTEVNFRDFFTPQPPSSDATVLLSQDPPQPGDLAVALVELPLAPIGGSECLADPRCLPESLSYHRITWSPVPYPEEIITDIFNRSETGQWGTANLGGNWTDEGGSPSDFSVTTVAPGGFDAGVHHTDTGTGPLYSTIGSGIDEVDIRTVLFLQNPAGIDGGGVQMGVVLRYQDTDNHYQVRVIVADPDLTAQIVLVEGGVETVLAEQVFPLAGFFNALTFLRVQASGEVIRAKVWDVNDAEPVQWPQGLAVADTTFPAGAVGLRSMLAADVTTGPVDAFYFQFAATGIQQSIFTIFGRYEIQRSDAVEPAWHTIGTIASPDVTEFNDYEARVGIASFYRVRITNLLDFPGPWSTIATAALPAPGVGGSADHGVLIFTSNQLQDGTGSLAYVMQWPRSPREAFDFPEVETQALQRIFGKDYFTAFRPLERGGEQFTRTLLVQNAAVAPPILDRAFSSLRDLAWEQLPYVCVRTEQGDRWFANVAVPDGEISNRRRTQLAQVTITQVTDTPAAIASTDCEGMVSLTTPIYAQAAYVQSFDEADEGFDLQLLARMDNWQAMATLAARLDEPEPTRLRGFILAASRGQFTLEVREWVDPTTISVVYASPGPIPFEPGELAWLRVRWVRDNGSGQSQATYYTSSDGVAWTPLGAAVTDPGQPNAHSTAPLQIGALQGVDFLAGSTALAPARGLTVSEARFYAAPAGTLLASPDFAGQPAGTMLFADDQDNTWQLVGGGTCQR